MPQHHGLIVVDDEPDILFIRVRALEKCGFPIDDLTNPIKALGHLEKHANEYSLVLSNIRMPGMSGIEFLNFVKRIRPDIPVMAMTTFSAFDEDVSRAVPWIKKEDIVQKPFKAHEVCDAVKKTLEIA